MAVDPSVIEALRAAADAEPANPHLRAHLAAALLGAEMNADALAASQEALTLAPDHVEGLRTAIAAADACGQSDLAAGYRRVLAGVSGADGVPSAVTEGVAEAATGESLDPFDAFLEEVLAEDQRSRVTLADVGGLADVKRRLQTSFIGPLANPELREMYRASLRGGLLLYGPPGCGKTFLARAVAGELGIRFLGVGLHEVLDMWLGNSEKNLHALFENARRVAPCVLFFDEVDAFGLKRSLLGRSAGRNVVAQLLTELDSVSDDNAGVFVLGATNAPWDLDAALRRPGRFDRTMLVLPPDHDARRAILRYHLEGRPVDTVDLDDLAKRTDGFSGADLRLVTEAAAELALADSMERGVARPVSQADLRRAATEVRPSIRAWFEIARNYATFANQDGEYDDLLAFMRTHRLS